MNTFKKGDTLLITKGQLKGELCKFVDWNCDGKALILLDGFPLPISIDADKLMVYCSHGHKEAKIEFKINDRVKTKDGAFEYTVTDIVSDEMVVVDSHWGGKYICNKDALELVNPTIDPAAVLDATVDSFVSIMDKIFECVADKIDEDIVGFGVSNWAVTVSNMGIEQYVESLFSKYINN